MEQHSCGTEVLRITAGSLRGRRIKAAAIEGLRPSPSRLRQAVSQMMGDLQDSHFLDLFSGSGLMALEAISRGASAVSIEHNRQACAAMRLLRDNWGLADRWSIHCAAFPRDLGRVQAKHFDFVYADPPYQQGYLEKIQKSLKDCSFSVDSLWIEERKAVHTVLLEGWEYVQKRCYGQSCVHQFTAMPKVEEQTCSV